MDLAIAYVPHVPTRIAQYRQYEFLYRPVSAIANAKAKLAIHDPTFQDLFCQPMTLLDRARWIPCERATISRRIGPDAMWRRVQLVQHWGYCTRTRALQML